MSPTALPRRLAPTASTARWTAAWLLLTMLGGGLWTLIDLGRQRTEFETQARIAHRLLSQRAVEHEAILRTLSLTQAAASPLLSSVYSRVLAVRERRPGSAWPDAVLGEAEAAASQPVPVLAAADLAAGHFTVLIPARGDDQAAYALDIGVALMIDPADWPFAGRAGERDDIALRLGGDRTVLQQALPATALRRLTFAKRLAADSQPFELIVRRTLTWANLPWAALAAWVGLTAALGAMARVALRQRQTARRNAELLRLGQVARVNALGELAAGLAHELNQPLAALVANAQAAGRLLDDDPPDAPRARAAMRAAAEQGQRAAAVVARLRQRIEARDATAAIGPIDLADLIRRAARLVEPDCEQEGIGLTLAIPERLPVQADAIAVEQIVHNLLNNARQALGSGAEPATKAIRITATEANGRIVLRVSDNGAGVPESILEHLFEPFVTTRAAAGGLGLGLSLSHTLAEETGGTLSHQRDRDGWTHFTLTLPATGAPA